MKQVSKMKSKQSADEMRLKRWLATRRKAGRKIDPETAEVEWTFAQTLDPYGVYPELPKEYQQVGREYFARSPQSDIWVSFDDLPKATREALWKTHWFIDRYKPSTHGTRVHGAVARSVDQNDPLDSAS